MSCRVAAHQLMGGNLLSLSNLIASSHVHVPSGAAWFLWSWPPLGEHGHAANIEAAGRDWLVTNSAQRLEASGWISPCWFENKSYSTFSLGPVTNQLISSIAVWQTSCQLLASLHTQISKTPGTSVHSPARMQNPAKASKSLFNSS